MPSLAASRITSTGKCFSSSHRIACGAIFSAAKSRAMSRTAIWSSLSVNCMRQKATGNFILVIASEAKRSDPFVPCGSMDCFVASLLAMTNALLVHRRHREVGAILDTGCPARGDRFGFGVEADRIRPVLIEIAEARTFPAAEGVVGDRHG